jgi:hypothetical protein
MMFVIIFTVIGPRSFATQLKQSANEDFIFVNCDVQSVQFNAVSQWAYTEMHGLQEECEFILTLTYNVPGITKTGRPRDDGYTITLPRTDRSVTSSGACGFQADSRDGLTNEEYFVKKYVRRVGSGVSEVAVAGWYNKAVPDKCYRLKATRYSYYVSDAEYRSAFDCQPTNDPYSEESACLSVLPKVANIEKGYMEEQGWKFVVFPGMLLFIINCTWASVRHGNAAEEARVREERRRCDERSRREQDEVIVDAEGYIIQEGGINTSDDNADNDRL